jgi:hypothetical protein
VPIRQHAHQPLIAESRRVPRHRQQEVDVPTISALICTARIKKAFYFSTTFLVEA